MRKSRAVRHLSSGVVAALRAMGIRLAAVVLVVLTVATPVGAASSSGALWGWGNNFYGQIGDGTRTTQYLPEHVGDGYTAISGIIDHSLAVKADGTVWAWGYNYYGQLGNGAVTRDGGCNCITSPVQATGLTGAIAVAGGAYHSLALKGDGTVWAWGSNEFGQVGDGGTSGSGTQRLVPSQVPSLANVVAIAAGYNISMALKSDGTVWVWGLDLYGPDQTHTTPVQVTEVSGVTAIAAGFFHSIAVKADGTVWAWGQNDAGQLGLGTATTRRAVPTQVAGIGGVVAVTGGRSHSMALKGDGTVWAWGYNSNGQLGNDSALGTTSTTPVQAQGLSNVTTIAAGGYHSLAVRGDHTLWAWGYNATGELGVASTDEKVPAQVTSLTGVRAIAAGWTHSLAIVGPSDTTAPTTLAATDRPANANGWYKAAVTVTLTAQDNVGGSGVAKTEYNLDGAGWATYTAPVSIAADGKHTLQYRSTDNAGNVEAPGSLPVWIDATAPTSVAGAANSPPNAAGWYNKPVGITFSGQDSLSGIDSCTSTTYSGPDSATASVSGACTDKAGNTSAPVAFTLKYDATGPTSVMGTPDRAANAAGWYNAPVTVTFGGTDATSGIASCTTTIYSGPDSASASVAGSCTDNAGNVAPAAFPLKYDATKPTVAYSGNAGTYTADQTVAITCTPSDNLSGIASTTCKDITGPAYTFAVGTNTFSATATDNAGNTSNPATTSFTMTVDAASLSNLVNQFVANSGQANALTTKIAKGNMQAFINEVNAQTGKALTQQQAQVLIKLANAL